MTGTMENEDGGQQLVQIASEALRAVGQPIPEPQIVRVGSTAIFQDSDAGLIVRIGGDGAEMRRNLRIALAMRQVDIPVLQPVSAEPLDIRGFCVTVWPLVTGGPRPSAQWLGGTARALHDKAAALSRVLASVGVSLKPFVPEELRRVRERIARATAAGIFASDELLAFSERVEHLALMLAEIRDENNAIVHGDLYPGNTVADDDETWLIDLDMVAIGPPVVDVAPEVVRERRFPGSGASYVKFVEGYGREPADGATVRLFADFREITMVSWIAELAIRKSAVTDEARHRLRTAAESVSHTPWTAA